MVGVGLCEPLGELLLKSCFNSMVPYDKATPRNPDTLIMENPKIQPRG